MFARRLRHADPARAYLGQGLPFGFQATALKVYLYEHGVSLAGVTLAGALSAPWLLKLLWAPLVERWGSPRFGPRRSWLVPLQLGVAALAAAAAALPPTPEALPWLLLCVLLMNLLAATQDIAVDGSRSSGCAAPRSARKRTQVVGFRPACCRRRLLVWRAAARLGQALPRHGARLALVAGC
jgi:MFS family permease